MAGYPQVERRVSARLPSQGAQPALTKVAAPAYGPSNAANRAQARKQRAPAYQPCQPRQGRAPLQKSSSLQSPSGTMKKSASTTKLEKPGQTDEQRPSRSPSGAKLEPDEVGVLPSRPSQHLDGSPRRPTVLTIARDSVSPRLNRQHSLPGSLPENLREAAVRLVSPRSSRSKSPEGASFAPVLGRAEACEKPEKPQVPEAPVRTPSRVSRLQPRQGISPRFSAVALKVEPQATHVSTPTQRKQFSLQRFTDAQKDTFARAISEIRAGRKSSCWMWFVIPTPPHVVHGVEKGSSVNRKFALRSDEEARAYLSYEHDGVNLRHNYLSIMTAIRDQLRTGKSAPSLIGNFDAPKLASSVKLFERLTRGSDEELHAVLKEVMTSMPTAES